MPLRCIDNTNGNNILAFDLNEGEWEALRAENRKDKRLRMPCCDARVVLKTSRPGTRFFAHHRVGDCVVAGETEHHLRLKQACVEVARDFGWDAATEVRGKAPDGEEWVADMLASKGDAKVCIEIQWSAQSYEETARRQRRYAESGVRCLWLMRETPRGYFGTEEVPIAPVARDEGEDGEYWVHLGGQILPVKAFLRAVFEGRFRYRTPEGIMGTVMIDVGSLECWRCKRDTNIVEEVHVWFGPDGASCRVSGMEGHPEVVRQIVEQIPKDLRVGAIKERYSKTEQGKYMSNGCGHCGALIGRFFEYRAMWDKREVARFRVRLDRHWRNLFRDIYGEEGHHERRDGWAVYAFDEHHDELVPRGAAASRIFCANDTGAD